MGRPIVIGNWKMNGSRDSNQALLQGIAAHWQGKHNAQVAVCPPFLYLEQAVQELAQSSVLTGAQDVSAGDKGAHTGDISAAMLADTGCHCVIVGHSERRQYHAECDELVASKARAALAYNLVPIICLGETLEQREAEQTLSVIDRQLQPVLTQLTQEQLVQSIIAYEPLWAIGSGRTATPEQAQEVHAYIRERLSAEVASKTRILYGGSVKPENVEALFAQPDIDGALVGGASLQADDFLAICRAADERDTRET